MKFTNLLTDEAAMAELGRRVAQARINRGLTQGELAEAAGVSKSTVERLEAGGSTQLSNLLRCLRALERLEGLEALLPEDAPRPLDLLERRGRTRRRVRHGRETAGARTPWTWGDGR